MFTVHYHTLGLAPGCSPEELRKRYLELVRKYPPETYPERFSKIHEAYDKLKDPLETIPDMFFTFEPDDSFEQITADILQDVRKERLPTEILLKMGET